jgi:Tfp pilus assembly protein PilO
MSLPFDREFISQVVIVTAVCAGAWFMLVQPKAVELARLERQMSANGETGALSTPDGIEALAGRVQQYNLRLGEIRRQNAVARDTSQLYGTIMNLAAARHVRVQAVQPSPPKDSSRQSPVRVARVTINVQGRFNEVSRFLDDMAQVDAFIRPTSLQMTPTEMDGEEAVSAHFGCDVLAFECDTVLGGPGEAPMIAGGTANGQP